MPGVSSRIITMLVTRAKTTLLHQPDHRGIMWPAIEPQWQKIILRGVSALKALSEEVLHPDVEPASP